MVLRRRSLTNPTVLFLTLSLLVPACSSTSSDENEHPESPCSTPLYQFERPGRIDLEAKASAVMCEGSVSIVRTVSRIDVTGDDLCPGSTDSISAPECTENAACGVG